MMEKEIEEEKIQVRNSVTLSFMLNLFITIKILFIANKGGWHLFPFMHHAHLLIDCRHIPLDMKYDVPFNLAIIIHTPSCV
jgi:hypothetical protein